MTGFIGPAQKHAQLLTYVLLTVTALATFVVLVEPRPDALPETARPVMLAE